jgi:2-polyprenyl-6-methoxyphenol hydroxylase-like FAD-dependent oxidoreductase
MTDADVCVVGGGPAGLVLGLLFARQGRSVVVLEKHADFLRDFRGDTVHPSTLDVMDELGLGTRLEELPHRKVRGLRITFSYGKYQFVAPSAPVWTAERATGFRDRRTRHAGTHRGAERSTHRSDKARRLVARALPPLRASAQANAPVRD